MEEAVSCVSVNKQFCKRLQFYVLEVHRTWLWDKLALNSLTPKDPCSGRTAPLTSKRCILYIYSTNTGTEYF